MTATASCTPTAVGDIMGQGPPVVLTGKTMTCTETASDPRVSGTSTIVTAGQTWGEGSPAAGTGWGDFTLTGPEGAWTGRSYDIASSSGVVQTMTVAVGDGPYVGWTYARSATTAADGTVVITGILMTGGPPPGFPVTRMFTTPDADLGPVPAVGEVAAALTGTLALGKGKGKPTAETVGPAGGTITISRQGDPLAGLTITVPPGSYASDTTFAISSRPIKGHSFGPLINPASPLVTIEAGDAYADGLVTVRIPATIPEGSFGMGFFYDQATGGLEGMPLVAEDPTGVTVATRHFSSFFVSVIELAALPPTVDSGFRPGVDDWQFTNYGSYIEPDGHCSGQVVSAMWYYIERQRSLGASHLHGLYDNNGDVATPDLWEDDSHGYRLASMVQHDTDWDRLMVSLLYEARTLPDWMHRAALRYAMAVSGEPQLVSIYQPGGGHAIVAYRVTRDFIQVADPNYPGKHRAIRWDEAEQDLRPYFSGANAAEIATSGPSSYPVILWFAKTAGIDWDQVGQRWAEFDAGTIGDGTFPGQLIEAQASDGSWVPLTDGFETTEPVLLARLRLPGAAWFRMDFYAGTSSDPMARDGQYGSDRFGPVRVALRPGANPFGIHIESFLGALGVQLSYVDFVRLSVISAAPPTGKLYTLRLRFDEACDTSAGPYDGLSRVNTLPVRIDGTSAVVDWMVDWETKHIRASGQGTYDPGTGALSIPDISVDFTRDRETETGEPANGTELLSVAIQGTILDDPARDGERSPLQATGSVEVDYPALYPSKTPPDVDRRCSATVTEAELREGWVDHDL